MNLESIPSTADQIRLRDELTTRSRRMRTFETHPKDIGLAIPRKIRIRKVARASKPEKVLQDLCEQYIQLIGLKKLHIPEFMLMAAFRYRSLSGPELHAAREAKDEIAGLPDLLIFNPRRQGYMLPVELKTEIGKISGHQKLWQAILGTVFCRSFEAFKTVVDDWKKQTEKRETNDLG